MTEWMISGILGFITGGAFIWFCKEPAMRFWKGTERFVGELEDQVRSLRQRLR
jgi:hypothetical protein